MSEKKLVYAYDGQIAALETKLKDAKAEIYRRGDTITDQSVEKDKLRDVLKASEKREAGLRETLDLIRSSMGDGVDLEHAADLLRSATNDHGINQTYNKNPYAISEQLEAMATFLGSEQALKEPAEAGNEIQNQDQAARSNTG